MADQTIREIIDERGGSAAVARGLSTEANKVRKSTVHTWVRNNSIPWWRRDAVMALPPQPKPARKSAEAQQQDAA